ENETLTIDLLRQGQPLTLQVTPERHSTQFWERRGLRYIGISPAISLIIYEVKPGTLAAELGLQPGDWLIGLDHTSPPLSVPELIDRFKKIKNENRPFHLTFRRGDSTFFDHVIQPDALNPDDPAPLGILWNFGGRVTLDHTDPITQIRLSIESMVNTIGALISPRSEINLQHMSGPVGILNIYHRLFQSEDGWRLAIWFSVILNVNLALLNLIPLPVLDGGHILMALIEKMIRRSLPYSLLEKITTACAIVLIAFMLYVTFYDIQDLPFMPKSQPPAVTEKIVTPAPEAASEPAPEPSSPAAEPQR
ncbi:MAG: site-2 protease family protein, partial [Methylacidiphilales bacterium]|nr:site-2 protease family protein [Candidatus Methylacidiphilales bacterium]